MGSLYTGQKKIQATEDSAAPEEAVTNPFKIIFEHISLHSAEAGVEPVGDYVMPAAPVALAARLAGEPAELSERMTDRSQEQDSRAEAIESERPEFQRLLNDILSHGGQELVERLEEQDARIEATECIRPEIGRLIGSLYVPLLLSILELSDEQFDAEYPGASHVSLEQRMELAEATLEHSEVCPRCSLKVSSDMEWEEHVNGLFRKTRRRRLYV